MQKKRWICAVLAVCMCAAVGCGKKEAGFDLSDYAVDTPTQVRALQAVEERAWSGEAVSAEESELLVLQKGAAYDVYNMASGKTVASDLPTQPVLQQVTTYRNVPVYVVKVNETNGQSRYLAADGTELLPTGDYRYTYFGYFYNRKFQPPYTPIGYQGMDSDWAAYELLFYACGEAPADASTGTVEYYFGVEGGDGYASHRFTPVHRPYIWDGPQLGETEIGLQRIPFGDGTVATHYQTIGNSIRFYRNGERVGSLDFSDCEHIGAESYYPTAFVGKYLYYDKITPSIPDEDDEFLIKPHRTLYRYDVRADKSEACAKEGFTVDKVMPIYNYRRQGYDAAVVTGYQQTNGKTIVGSTQRAYIADAELNFQVDITDIWSTGQGDLRKLDDKHLLFGGFIGTNDGDIIMQIDRQYEKVYPEWGLIAFYKNGLYGFKDFDGKVVARPQYRWVDETCYDGVLAAKYSARGVGTDETEVVLLRKSANSSEFPQVGGATLPYVGDSDGTVEVQLYNGFYTVCKQDGNAYVFSVISFNGETVQTSRYTADAQAVARVEQIGDNYYFFEADAQTGCFKLTF